MVVLFLESSTPDFAVTPVVPVKGPRTLLLHSAVVPLSRTLEKEGAIVARALLSIPAGEYTLASVEKAIAAAVSLGVRRPAKIVGITLEVVDGESPNEPLRKILRIPESAKGQRFAIDWPKADVAWVHCDLVNTDCVLRGGTTARRADLLGVLGKSGQSKCLTYSSTYPIRIRARSVACVYTIRFRVLDGGGGEIHLPIDLVLEIE
ncbi:hypothetical protein QZH41_005207 [Actinostola sp. cb2023]|nr:hypothetical protein QZH41_005207 [Actinostola sp. cb2023]